MMMKVKEKKMNNLFQLYIEILQKYLKEICLL